MLNKLLYSLITLALVASILLSVAYYRYSVHINTPIYQGVPKDLIIHAGESAHSILRKMREINKHSLPLFDRVWLKLNEPLTKIKKGHYLLDETETLNSLFGMLSNGKQKQFSISLIEGQTYTQWLTVLRTAEKLNFNIDESYELYQLLIAKYDFCKNDRMSLEGCLLSDTYFYSAGESATSIIERAYVAMHDQLTKIWDSRYFDIQLSSPYQLLKMASIIEKETGVASERAVISGVFDNRLKSGMRLQTDPTVIYGIGENFDGNITRKHLRTPTEYNTYVINGLPITPISMVGQAALDAAARPAQTNYLYFVSKGDGTHHFSETLSEHNTAVRKYQLGKGQ